MRLLITILLVCFSKLYAQVTANAGNDQTISKNQNQIRLSGSQTGGTTIMWACLNKGAAYTGNIKHGNTLTPDVIGLCWKNPAYYDFELVVSNGVQTAKDTVRITLDYGTAPPQYGTGVRYANAGDISTIPGCASGDLIIPGANTHNGQQVGGLNTDIFLTGILNSFPLGPGKKVFIKGGKYRRVYLSPNAGVWVGSKINPIIITPYDAQLEIAEGGFNLLNGHGIKVTGYEPGVGIGNTTTYGGHITNGYAFSTGKYGIYCNAQWNNISGFGIFVGGVSDSIEICNIEVGNGYFAGSQIKNENGTDTFQHFTIHDLYIHDIHGEGIYFGSTGADPQNLNSNWKIYNNRILRAGNEVTQFGQQGTGNDVYNNVFTEATNWRSPFARSQAFANQFGMRGGGNKFRNNVIIGTGEYFMNFFSQSKSGYTSEADTVFLRNNFFKYAKGHIGNYMGGATPVANMKVVIDSNFFGGYTFQGNQIYSSGGETTNTQEVIRTAGGTVVYILKNNVRDNTKTTWISGATNLDSSGNTSVSSLTNPNFINTGFSNDFDVIKFERWTDSIYWTWKDEFLNPSGVFYKDPTTFASGDYVMFNSRIYKSLVNGNSGNVPQLTTDSFWELQTWNLPGGGTTTTPPDDYRLSGDVYAKRKMGLLDNILYREKIILKGKRFRIIR